jgi:lipid II:glycine glycyltransferase (peptidoglycan interpeptide bridge formation enzyme)
MVKIFLAYHMGKVIGVLYLFTYRERVTISYTTSLFEYQNKRPNDFLYWEAIKWSSANGYRVFDFGGAGNPHKEYGVREFKKHFGGEMVDYGRFTKIYQPSLMRCIDLAIRIRKKI